MLEIVEDGTVRATRFTLGSEPTDPELYEFLRRHGVALLERAASALPVPSGGREAKRVNPKRAAKLAARAAAGVSRRSTASADTRHRHR